MSKIEDAVVRAIYRRSLAGEAKYGVTMERTDLNNVQWLHHLQEELLDAAIYIEKLIEIEVKRKAE